MVLTFRVRSSKWRSKTQVLEVFSHSVVGRYGWFWAGLLRKRYAEPNWPIEASRSGPSGSMDEFDHRFVLYAKFGSDRVLPGMLGIFGPGHGFSAISDRPSPTVFDPKMLVHTRKSPARLKILHPFRICHQLLLCAPLNSVSGISTQQSTERAS